MGFTEILSGSGVEIDTEALEMERGRSLADRNGTSKRVTGDAGRESSKEEKLEFIDTIKLRASIIEDRNQNKQTKCKRMGNCVFGDKL